ncbi:RAD55 family ATPase [Halovivax gelatinilyticus]|uniref:RAD55 family ATPase n=1 Tax=Halovivax gelatinilyticus TaxID=2961597 RepID=UPI0020CA55E0|nr:HTR-like protein [Halovivax gelatinilyticus]
MDRIPFGISRLDATIGGGAPAGSVVLLAGDVGAGAREFCYTSAAMNGLAAADPSQFELYYGDLEPAATLPGSVHYVSFTDEPAAVLDEMRFSMADDLVDAASDELTVTDLAQEYFQLTPVPTDWYAETTPDIRALGESQKRRDVLEVLGEHLTANAPGNLVVIDSLTDLLIDVNDDRGPTRLTYLLKGLSRATYRWGGLVLLLVNTDSIDDLTLGRLKDAVDGTLSFEWESGGSERARTLVVEEFRGVLSRIESENIVRFETDVHDAGFDISNVRKIR